MNLRALNPVIPLERSSPDWLGRLLLLVAMFTGYRLWVVWSSGLGLFYDESYYWHWAQSLEWGYYSKPPMIAWVIAATSQLFGDATPLAVKAGAFVLHPLTTLGLFLLGRRLFDARIGFVAGALYLSSPGLALSGLIISTDVPLLCCWVWAMWLFHRALDGQTLAWLSAGLLAGLGLLSKYTMILFLPAVLLVLAEPAHRHWLARPQPYLAMLIAAACLAPNVYWNAVHGFPTLQHTYEISGLPGGSLLQPGKLLEFWAAQFGVFGPVATLLFALGLWRWPRADQGERFALCFTLPMLAAISLQALLSGANANWAAPAIAGVCLFAAAELLRRRARRWLAIALALNLALNALVYHLPPLWRAATGASAPAAVDPASRSRGWDRIAAVAAEAAIAQPRALVVSNDRAILASLAYYQRFDFSRVRAWAPPRPPRHHYELMQPLSDAHDGPVLLLARRPPPAAMLARFDAVELVAEHAIEIAADKQLHLWVYRADGFAGYR